MKRLAVVALICLGALGLLPAGAGAVSPAPAWTIEMVPYPSAFEAGSAYDLLKAGPGYLVQAYDVGGKATSGTFTVTATVPKGLLPSAEFPPHGAYGPPNLGRQPTLPLNCSALGRKVTCTGGGEGPVNPGEAVTVIVPVEVDGSATGTLTAKAAIEDGGAAKVEASTPTPISNAPSQFGFIEGPGFYGSAIEADGTEARLAGSHPYAMTVAGMNLATNPNTPGVSSLLAAGGGLREAKVELPHGIVVNPQATERCKESELEDPKVGCPDDAQVGTAALTLSVVEGFGEGPSILPVYNMVPPPGYPAEFGFEVVNGSYVHLLGSVSSDGSFTLTASSRDTLARATIGGVRTTLWGEPSAESHDRQRGECLGNQLLSACPTPRTRKAFVTLPAPCSGPLVTTAHLESWLGAKTSGSYDAPQAIEGCEALLFEPAIEARPTTSQADSPSGLEFDLLQTQDEEYEDEAGNPQRATAPLENTTVVLPPGMALNPSAGNGREACTSDQIGLATAPGEMPIRWHEEPAHCPAASKVGTAQISTPLLDHELQGSVYLAKPFQNPFNSLLAIYLVVEDEATGIIAKLAGKVEADALTGQLRTTFSESPQLPLEDVHLSLFEGPRAALTTPLTCGEKTTTGSLTPWSTSSATPVASSFQITSAPGGGTCPSAEAQAPNSPSLSAGTTSPVGGTYSPFVLRLKREDGSQRIARIDTTLPEGLTGKLAGVSECSNAQIAQAEGRDQPEEGALERRSPSCPQASEIGTATVGAGSGPDPLYVQGNVYLAGPYKGAPLSVVAITPAVAGPFDLGVVVVRVALEVDPETARITAKSDPLPTILDGIPLDVRSIALDLDRSDFTLNPTNCTTQSIGVTSTSPAGSAAQSTEPFGVEGCQNLGFAPKVKIQLTGSTNRIGHPGLKAVVTMPPGDAGIAATQVGLPHALFLDNANFNKTCTRPVLAEDACPAASVYGHAKAWTPLLEKPLEGNVYLVGGFGYKLPALVAELNGQIRVLLHSRVDTTKQRGLRNTFEFVPDAPVSRFELRMKGGKKYSLLENSEDLCEKPRRASVRFTAQNGKVVHLNPKIAVNCGKKAGNPKK